MLKHNMAYALSLSKYYTNMVIGLASLSFKKLFHDILYIVQVHANGVAYVRQLCTVYLKELISIPNPPLLPPVLRVKS